MAFLPIHAAGLYEHKGQPKIYDYVVSSYTPTLSALTGKTPLRKDLSDFRGILAVSQPTTPGLNELPGTG